MPRVPLSQPLASGPFTIQQGRDLGLGMKRMRGSDLQHPFHGVRSPATGTLGIHELCLAYQQHMPQHAYFCDATAARIIGIPLPRRSQTPPILDVAVPPPHRAPAGHGVRGHTLSAIVHVHNWHGVRVSSPESTWCRLGTTLSVGDLVAAGDFLIHHRLPITSRARLEDALMDYPGRRGLPGLRAALELLDDHSESPQESRLRVIIVTAGITGVTANLQITASGGFRYRADLALLKHKVILEYQSRFHDGSKEFRADMTRISRLEADGWYVMQVNSDDLDGPVELVERLQRVLAGR